MGMVVVVRRIGQGDSSVEIRGAFYEVQCSDGDQVLA
jgi:hypothetical protein